jgi:hypothetical protein
MGDVSDRILQAVEQLSGLGCRARIDLHGCQDAVRFVTEAGGKCREVVTGGPPGELTAYDVASVRIDNVSVDAFGPYRAVKVVTA